MSPYSTQAPLLSIGLWISIALLPGCGAISSLISVQESTSASHFTISVTEPQVPSCYAPELRLSYPVVVNAIGISRYGRAAAVDSTPAHMLGAAIFQQPFKLAGLRTKQMLRNQMTFGDNQSPVFSGPTDKSAVRSVAVSPDDDRVAAAYAVETGGAVYVWTRKGDRVAQFSRDRQVKQLRFARNDLLALLDADNRVELARIDGKEVALFPHPTAVRTFEVNSQGTQLLTVAEDKVVRVWPIGENGEPASFAIPPKQCWDNKLDRGRRPVRFDRSGIWILVSGCDGVWGYDTRQLSSPPFQLPIAASDGIAAIEISPDVRTKTWITEDGKLRFGTVSVTDSRSLPSVPEREPYLYSRDFRPLFSGDGTKVAVRARDGTIHLWNLDSANPGPIVLFDPSGVETLEFSANGNSLLGTSEGRGSRTFSWNLSSSQHIGAWDFVAEMTLVSPVLVAGAGTATKLTSSAIDATGSTAWIGFEDGRLAAFGLVTTPAIESRFQSDFTGDVYVRPYASDAEGYADPTYELLRTIGGVDLADDKLLFVSRNLKKDHQGTPTMTREKVTNMRSLFATAEQTHKYNGSVMLILYVAAHGWIGADGKPVVLPGDADRSDPASWIPYQWFVDEVDRFVGNDKTRRAIIIFDTCQHAAGGGRIQPARPKSASPYVSIVESTSPGQYAWHWRAESKFRSETTVENEKRWGFPYLPPKAPRGSGGGTMETTMSLFSLASTCAFAAKTDEVRKFYDLVGVLVDDPPPGMKVGEWLDWTEAAAEVALDSIQDRKKADERQKITRTKGIGNDEIRLFGFEY